MGGMVLFLPTTYIFIFIGSISLMGIPFLSGFFSKDLIIETSFIKFSIITDMAFFFATFATFYTGFYSLRLLVLIFIVTPNSYRLIFEVLQETHFIIINCLMLLSYLSIFAGYITFDLFVGLGTDFWNAFVWLTPNYFYTRLGVEYIPFFIKLMPLVCSVLGVVGSILYISIYNVITTNNVLYRYKIIYMYFNQKSFIEILYNKVRLYLYKYWLQHYI